MSSAGFESVAQSTIFRSVKAPDGEGFGDFEGREVYRIPNYDRLPPFLMTLVSDVDLWMYVSSRGGLTAGRVNESGALFPYETDDKLHLCHPFTGPVTLVRLRDPRASTAVWQPFAPQAAGEIQRNLYKTVAGDRIVFEEVNDSLGLTFRYAWSATEGFGFVRTCTLLNHGGRPIEVDVLDGLLNLLPAGADLRLQQQSSCLINAYTRCEVDPASGLAIFAINAMITDGVEPAESLHANVAWYCGQDPADVLLSTDQLQAFREGRAVFPERLLKGRRGAYLASFTAELQPGCERCWRIMADARLDHGRLSVLMAAIADRQGVAGRLSREIQRSSENLQRLLASADGLQMSADHATSARHQANVLFNIMRGGVFVDNGEIVAADFKLFLRQRNRIVSERHLALLGKLPTRIARTDLLALASGTGDANFVRLCLEYLPLTFSRRHGDPSRPWNRFSIRVRNDDGSRALNYQGNWRDIFQNWEALCASYPTFLESMIAKFVNATTIDGFNPYRITRGGIDWETPDPDDPWSNIGYWGDHQVVYLLKLLEAIERTYPRRLDELLSRPIFSYANVPYRLKPHREMLRDRRNTVEYDVRAARSVEQRVRQIGSDGKLVLQRERDVYHVSLLEKLLVSALSKLSNLVLDGGIWMNTQRPEWNDANNALVGNGVSVVTLCYLRRYVAFCARLLDRCSSADISVSIEVVGWLDEVARVLEENRVSLERAEIADVDRKRVLDELGLAFSRYREAVYAEGFSGCCPLSVRSVVKFLGVARRYIDHSIEANRRVDGLYHAYNLLQIRADGESASLERLEPMLEGQVAVLSSGLLTGRQSLRVIQALFDSPLYRADQQSFMLYPDRELPAFLEKNRVPPETVETNGLLWELIEQGDASLISRDAAGHYHFSAGMRNSREVERALDRLQGSERWGALVRAQRQSVLDLYESVFHHGRYTGRSGAMHAYEGLGSVYWHMVSKLLLAVQECHRRALEQGESQEVIDGLRDGYFRIRGGLGFNKSSSVYGAFPTDPYSHTPRHAGAQQPGMTGQVKEEILTRLGELGVIVEGGCLRFAPTLLRRSEFDSSPRDWCYYDLWSQPKRVQLPPGSLAFTFCQVPILFHLGGADTQIRVIGSDHAVTLVNDDRLGRDVSGAIFDRAGDVVRIEVSIPPSRLC